MFVTQNATDMIKLTIPVTHLKLDISLATLPYSQAMSNKKVPNIHPAHL